MNAALLKLAKLIARAAIREELRSDVGGDGAPFEHNAGAEHYANAESVTDQATGTATTESAKGVGPAPNAARRR